MNFGLVKQVVLAFQRFAILKLGKTYLSLSIAEIVKRTFLDSNDFSDVARDLEILISTGQLNATLTQRGTTSDTWILRFNDEVEAKSEAQQLRELKATEARLLDLSARITESDQKIGISKEYLEWCRKAEAKSKDGASGFSDIIEDFTQDEDMMVDV